LRSARIPNPFCYQSIEKKPENFASRAYSRLVFTRYNSVAAALFPLRTIWSVGIIARASTLEVADCLAQDRLRAFNPTCG